jgi:hypothetical protein
MIYLTKMKLLIITLPFFIISAACSSLQAGFYVLVSNFDGAQVLQNEPDVKLFLEHIHTFSENYTITAYKRKTISYKIKKTTKMTHSFYVIIDNDGNYYTLSFAGTKKTFKSQGAWVINSDTDIGSYELFIHGDNIWEVEEIKAPNGIDTKNTVDNVLLKIESGTTYYYKSHISKNPDQDNCNTALEWTLVERGGDE